MSFEHPPGSRSDNHVVPRVKHLDKAFTYSVKVVLPRPIKDRKRIPARYRPLVGWHEFRHTFASRLAQEGVSLYKICKWLGHADMKTTQIYAHFAPVYDRDIERLSISLTKSDHEKAGKPVP